MQSKLINLSDIIINNDVSCENKDQQQKKTFQQQFFCYHKSDMGQHLGQHCQLPPPIPMAAIPIKQAKKGTLRNVPKKINVP